MKDNYKTAILNDPISTSDLINTALIATDEETQWNAVSVLQFRGNQEVFEAASALCKSLTPEERSLGARILGQLGIPERTFPEQSTEILLQLLSQEETADVLCATGIALGHLRAEKAIPALAALKNHPDAEVRYGVVGGLLCQEDEQAIQTLIELSSDQDWDVRNWATFGLGSMIETNTEAVRDALFQRLMQEPAGEGDEIYGEALVGLATRKDRRLINPLAQELNAGCVGVLAVEAAETIGAPELYDALVSLRDWWDVNRELLERAIATCTPESIEVNQ